MPAATIMVQGTSSNAGKTAMVAAICRVLRRSGLSVCPFKPQNMSNNSAVTADGGEIGRAQALQALACDLEPMADMNPVLLKPTTATGAQVIVQGRPAASFQSLDARTYHAQKPQMMKFVLESYRRLSERFDVIVVEGAGSPAEINLREGDIANMGFVEAIDYRCPVILIGDIDRGGVFAQLVGTMALLGGREAESVKGFIINKFRGDASLLDSGLSFLARRTGKPILGVMPFIENLHLEAEDSLSGYASERESARDGGPSHPRGSATNGWWQAGGKLKIAAPRFPHISNATDLDPLILHPAVDLRFAAEGDRLMPADLIILPGSKSVVDDLTWLREMGWEEEISRHLRYGGKLLGICGGFQMLGASISDPHRAESDVSEIQALGWLDLKTTFLKEKELKRVSGRLSFGQETVTGYEIHMGRSEGKALSSPLMDIDGRGEGAISSDNQIIGTYVHGLFESRQACQALLKWAGLSAASGVDYGGIRLANLDRLADTFQKHIDMVVIYQLLEPLKRLHRSCQALL